MTQVASTLSSPQTSGRDRRVESLRGLAIVLLVFYHAIDTAQLRVGVLAWVQGLIEPFIMPAFAVMSGYVYALKPVQRDGLARFAVNKLNRIAVPMLIASTGLYLLRAAIKGDQPYAEVWRVWFLSYDYFWFLQALLLIFATVAVIDVLRLAQRWWSWLIVLILAFEAQQWIPGSEVLSFWGLLYLLPSFLIGLGLQRFGTQRSEGRTMTYAVVIAAMALVVHQLAWFGVLQHIDVGRTDEVSQVLGIALTLALILRGPCVSGLIGIAAVSYTIYLYHGLGLAIGERLGRVMPESVSVWASLVFKFALGLAIPIAMDLLLRRVTFLRRGVLGRK